MGAPDIATVDSIAVPAAPVEMTAPDVLMPQPVEVASPDVIQGETEESQSLGISQIPSPITIETIREQSVEKTHTEKTETGTTKRVSITIQNLTLPGVTDAGSFIDELEKFVNGHDGSN
jgi:hypothetical protein